jgi:hypothetical protein
VIKGANFASSGQSHEATRESPGWRGRSKNSTAVSKFHCVLRAVSARNHFGAAVVVLLPTKSDPYPSGCLFGIARLTQPHLRGREPLG